MGDFGPRRDYGRVRERSYRGGGYDREKRLQVTIGVGAAILLIGGCGIGFALGRASAPKPVIPAADSAAIVEETTLPVGVVEDVPTDTIDAFTDDVTMSDEATEDTEPDEAQAAGTGQRRGPGHLARLSALVEVEGRQRLGHVLIRDSGPPVERDVRRDAGHQGAEVEVVLRARAFGAPPLACLGGR